MGLLPINRLLSAPRLLNLHVVCPQHHVKCGAVGRWPTALWSLVDEGLCGCGLEAQGPWVKRHLGWTDEQRVGQGPALGDHGRAGNDVANFGTVALLPVYPVPGFAGGLRARLWAPAGSRTTGSRRRKTQCKLSNLPALASVCWSVNWG